MNDTKLKTVIEDATTSGHVPKKRFEKALPYIQTFVMYLTFIVLGSSSSIIGPTLQALGQIVQVDKTKMGVIYTARSVGYLVGCFGGGVVFDYVNNKKILLIILSLVMSTSAFLMPFCPSLYFLQGNIAIGGISMAVINTGVNVLCLQLWRQDAGPFFQALHFSFGVGGFLGPLIAAPFVSSRSTNDTNISNTSTSNWTEIPPLLINDTGNTTHPNEPDSQIVYAYSIIAAIGLLVTFLWCVMLFYNPKTGSTEDTVKQVDVKLPSIRFTIVAVAITAVLIYLQTSMEVGFSQMLPLYANQAGFGLDQSESSYLTSVYWGAYMVTRFCTIFFAYKVSSLVIIIIDVVFTVTGSLFLIVLSRRFILCLWVGTAFIGIGLATLFPTTLSWLDRHINLTNKVTSVFVTMGSISEMVIPLVLVMYVDIYWAALFYFILASALFFGLFLSLLAVLFTRQGEKYVKEDSPQPISESNSSGESISNQKSKLERFKMWKRKDSGTSVVSVKRSHLNSEG